MLREADVRAMLRLMGEVCELPRNRPLRTAHMLEGLCRVTGAQSGTVTFARHEYDGAGQRTIHVLDGHATGIDARGQAVIAEYLKTLKPHDPLSDPLYSTQGALVVRGREQLMESPAWHRSAHFNEVRRGFGVDDCIAAKVEVSRAAPVQVQTVCIHRSLRDGRFGKRHWRMIELFLDEARPFIHPESPVQAAPRPSKPLSPRLRQVLECLLRGDGTKQVAARLGLSIHTVNDYMKELHRRFGVSSRSELLALFVNRSGLSSSSTPGSP